MKHIQRKTVLLGSVLGVAVGLFAGALVLGERLSPPVSGLCFGVAGILGGVAGSRLIMARVERNWTPEERKEIERGERDERNVTIREKAAYSSWYWSLYLLWGLWPDPRDDSSMTSAEINAHKRFSCTGKIKLITITPHTAFSVSATSVLIMLCGAVMRCAKIAVSV